MFRIQSFDSFITDIKKYIFNMMGDRGDRIEFHHCRRAFDRMHDTEDLIYVIGGKITVFLISNQHFV